MKQSSTAAQRIHDKLWFFDLEPSAADFRTEVLQGLAKPIKQISSKFFYDEEGRALFDLICQAPEYYPTDAGIEILKDRAAEMALAMGKRVALIEYGSGNSEKVMHLLRALFEQGSQVTYVSIDIAREHLLASAQEVCDHFPELNVLAICADYSQTIPMARLLPDPKARRIAFFPGSSIGNFTRAEAVLFLRRVNRLVGSAGGLLIGVDLKKDPVVLHDAYNDAKGVTARFNLNLLQRINRELDGDFNLKCFRHYAFYRPEKGRVEMHLVSLTKQSVHVGGRAFAFEPGESIHTEISCKYTLDEFSEVALQAKMKRRHLWTDRLRRFSIQMFGSQ